MLHGGTFLGSTKGAFTGYGSIIGRDVLAGLGGARGATHHIFGPAAVTPASRYTESSRPS
jgi:hypothetical protein